jgi:hypothetical protein
MTIAFVAFALIGLQKSSPSQFQRSVTNADQLAFAFRTQDPSVNILHACDLLSKSGSTDQQAALYFRGRYYQRNYELSLYSRPLGVPYIKSAVTPQYEAYISKFKGKNLYSSDVRFYKAFAYLWRDEVNKAIDTLSQMDTSSDPTIYVDSIVWTSGREFVLRRTFESRKLRDAAKAFITAHRSPTFVDSRVQAVARDIRDWAVRYKG